MSDQTDALLLIISKTPALAGVAAQAMLAAQVGSPVTAQRVTAVIRMALDNYASQYTGDERAALALLLTGDDEDRSYTLRVRLTPAERLALEQDADRAGQTISEHVRRRLFG